MYKRDLITAEIQKLAEVLARILGQKNDLPPQDILTEIDSAISTHFGIDTTELIKFSEAELLNTIGPESISTLHLNELANFLFERWRVTDRAEQTLFGNTLLVILNSLDHQRGYVSFENMDKVRILKKSSL